MASKRIKKIWVRHENLNGEEIALQRRVLNPWAFVFPILFLSKWGYVWKRWKLLNATLYEKEQRIAELVDQIVKLNNECYEIEEDLKREKKDVTESTRQTYGYSAPFLYPCPIDELPFKKQKWITRPDGSWRKYLNPRAFKGLKGTGKVTTREKVGANEEPRSVRTAYVPENLSKYKMALEEGNADIDSVMAYKEPQQNRKKSRNDRNRNNQNRNNHRDDDRYDDDDDDY